MGTIRVLMAGCLVIQYVLTPADCVPLGVSRTRGQSAERDARESVPHRNRTLVFLSPPVINGDTSSYGGDLLEENSREVRETQHATCKITTEELVATAKATVTRVLKGLCNSREMEERFSHLENHLTKQLDVLKALLLKLEDQGIDHDQSLKKGQRRIQSTLLRNCPGGVGVGVGVGGVDLHTTSTSGTYTSTVSDVDVSMDVSRSEEETTPLIDASLGPRDAEFNTFNSTVHTESSPLSPGQVRTVFTYFWRVPSINYKLTSWSHRRSLRSPSFYIAPEGYRMYIRIYPRQSGENVYVHVGLTRGEHDDKLSWPFKLKHRISIIDQSADGAIEDIMSRIWDPVALCSGFNWQRPTNGDNYECVGLGFPHDVVRSRNYINRDNLVIKLIVYMD